MTISRDNLHSEDLSCVTTGEMIPPVLPGEHLAEIMEDYGITAYRLAHDIGVSQTRISEIIRGRRSISADTASRLGIYFRMSAQFWLNLQTSYDLSKVDIPEVITPLAVA